MAQGTAVGLGTGWSEVYMGGSREAELALFEDAFPRVERIQEFVARKQHAVVRRAFHNKGVAVSVEFEVSPDLPDHLRVGFLSPGAAYRGFGRFSRSQSFHGRDGELDQRGFAFRLQTPEGPQDFLLSNTPTSFAPDPVMFLRVATIFTEHSRPIVPLKLFWALGIREGIRVLRNLLQAPDRAVAFTSQRYWSRTPFEIGVAASRFMVRPTSEPRRVQVAEDPDFLASDLKQDLRQRSRSFELCAQLFVDENVTPIEDSSHEWLEAVATPVVLGRVMLPQQDLDGAESRELANRIEGSETFNPWNTPCLRPLGRTNRARLEAYNRSAAKRGAEVLPVREPAARGGHRRDVDRSPRVAAVETMQTPLSESLTEGCAKILLKAGLGLALAGIGLAVFGSRPELQAIYQALTRRLKAGIVLVLAGIGLTLIGLRLEGQVVFRRIAGRFRRLL